MTTNSKNDIDIENLCEIFNEQTNVESNKPRSSIKIHRPLTISTLAHYFGIQCDEYLRLSVLPSNEEPNREKLNDILARERGILFEEKVKSFYSLSILQNIHDENDFLSYLRSFISSPTDQRIGYNVKFRWTYDRNIQSNYKPDFLLIRHLPDNENRTAITIVDTKSSSSVRIEHCVQVALYAIDLQVWIERHRLDQSVFISDIGEIWLPTDAQSIPYQIKSFPMRKLQERIRFFLKNSLENVLNGSEWMMLPRCSSCPFVRRCRERVSSFEPESINNLSYLTPSSYSLIRSVFKTDRISSIDLEHILRGKADGDSLYANVKNELETILSINMKDKTSAAIKAIQTHEPQIKQHVSFMIPKQNDNLILMFYFIIPNASELHSIALFAYNIYDTSTQSWFYSRSFLESYPTPTKVVQMIAQSLHVVKKQEKRPCQIVLFDEQEKFTLFEQLALASDSEHIGECLILLKSSENAILLSHPPNVIQSDRLFRSHPLSNMKKGEIQQELIERYGASGGDYESMKKADLLKELRKLNTEEQENARQNLVGLPCFICLHTAIRQSFIVPAPGYFDLEDLKYLFDISLPLSNSNKLLELICERDINDLVQERFNFLSCLYLNVQKRLSQSNHLELNAHPLPEIVPINNHHPHLRRLIFLRQYEMLYTLSSFQRQRLDSNEPPVQIRIINKIQRDKYDIMWECQVERGHEIISKNFNETIMNKNDFLTYPYLIFEDKDSIRTFCDAVYMDMFVACNRSGKKLNRCGFAHVESNQGKNSILVRVRLSNLSLEVNHLYYLSERYVDFNTKKTIEGLEKASSLAIEILDDPRKLKKPEAIQKMSRQSQQEIVAVFTIRQASIKPEGLHILNRSQQKACEQVKNERVTLIWGPPGTGKTYWSAVTVFQMLMFSSTPLHILVTACTHTAIDHLLMAINKLKDLFSSTPQLPQWHELAQNMVLLKLESNNLRDVSTVWDRKKPIVIGSTVWTLHKLDNSKPFDVIFIDESTQLLTADAIIALNHLSEHDESRLIVAGDPLQLPPIKQCTYPSLPYPVPDLFSSLFHCLLRDKNNFPISLQTEKPFEQISNCPYLSIFDENHRMNDQLTDFTRLLYGENYRQSYSMPLLTICPFESNGRFILGSILEPHSSLYTVFVESNPYAASSFIEDLKLESDLVYSLVDELVSRMSISSIFIITPHRMQRSAIRQKLGKDAFPSVSIICDTVERMQGKEAQCVILCMLYRKRDILENELDFIYNRQRINVSITRAQQLCILITSKLLYNEPPLNVFVDTNARNAYTLLNNYVSKSTTRLLDKDGNVK